MKGIRALRRVKNLTQEEVSHVTGIPRFRISLLERGLTPRPGEIEKIESCLLQREPRQDDD